MTLFEIDLIIREFSINFYKVSSYEVFHFEETNISLL